MEGSVWLWYKDSHGKEIMQPCSSLQNATDREASLRAINDINGKALLLKCLVVFEG